MVRETACGGMKVEHEKIVGIMKKGIDFLCLVG